MKKIFMTAGSLAAVTTSASVISCSTSWTTWSKSSEGEKAFDYSKYIKANDPRNHPLSYQVRNTYLDKSAYIIDKQDVTINLSQINNVNELVYVIKKILNANLPDDLDKFWNDFTDNDANNDKRLLNYVKDMPSVLKIKLILNGTINNVDWNIEKFKQEFETIYQEALTIRGEQSNVDAYLKALPTDTDSKKEWNKSNNKPTTVSDVVWKIHQMKKFDVQVDGVKDGLPNNFAPVAKAGGDLINLDVVKPILSSDPSFALRLSKLVNLPGDALNTNPKGNVFKSIKTLLSILGTFLNSMFDNDAITYWNSITTLKTDTGDLYKVNNKILHIAKKDYSLSEAIINGQKKQTWLLKDKDNKTIFIAKVMNEILKK